MHSQIIQDSYRYKSEIIKEKIEKIKTQNSPDCVSPNALRISEQLVTRFKTSMELRNENL